MRFTKMHGIGNDFVMVNALGKEGDSLAEEARRRSASLCDRNFGVGADGVILILPGDRAPFRMRIYNADGSESEMCGNGVRCFGKYVFDRGLSQGSTEIPVETGAGTLILDLQLDSAGKVDTVQVDMGEPVLIPERIPTTLGAGNLPVINEPIVIDGRKLYVTLVSMGNPHAVIFVNDVASFPVALLGPLVETDPAFPRRTNTEFIEVVNDREVNFRVWERGVGETMACGTGACAAVVASVLNHRTGRDVSVHLPGGDLRIEWSEADNHVYMTGPATDVFEGEV